MAAACRSGLVCTQGICRSLLAHCSWICAHAVGASPLPIFKPCGAQLHATLEGCLPALLVCVPACLLAAETLHAYYSRLYSKRSRCVMALALCHTNSISACESVRRVAAGVGPTRQPNNSVCGLGCSSQAESSALKALPASACTPCNNALPTALACDRSE